MDPQWPQGPEYMCCSGYEFRKSACIPYKFAPSLGNCQHCLHLLRKGVVDLRMLPEVPLGCSGGCTVVKRLVSLTE